MNKKGADWPRVVVPMKSDEVWYSGQTVLEPAEGLPLRENPVSLRPSLSERVVGSACDDLQVWCDHLAQKAGLEWSHLCALCFLAPCQGAVNATEPCLVRVPWEARLWCPGAAFN